MKPIELISACQMFLVPVSILFGALGVATTEQLKTLISLMGVATSIVWSYRIWKWPGLEGIDQGTALALAFIFMLAWLAALATHAYWWAEEHSRKRRAAGSEASPLEPGVTDGSGAAPSLPS